MKHTPLLLLAFSLLLGTGCADTTEFTELPPPVRMEPLADVEIRLPLVPVTLPPLVTGLERCFHDGGAFLQVGEIDNDDTTEHGEVTTLAVNENLQVAVGSVDGVVKLWTLDGFVTELNTASFAYGIETSVGVPTDLAFLPGRDGAGMAVVAGDERGLVTSLDVEFSFPNIVGGTEPDTAISAVAVEAIRGLVAHADVSSFGRVTLRDPATGESFGPLETAVEDVRDLAFLEGALVVAGAGEHALEVRSGATGETVGAFVSGEGFAAREIAVAGDVLAAVDDGRVRFFHGADLTAGVAIETPAHRSHSIALGQGGRVAFTLGDEGSLRAWSTENGAELGAVALPDGVSVRTDPAGEIVFTAALDGSVRAFVCER